MSYLCEVHMDDKHGHSHLTKQLMKSLRNWRKTYSDIVVVCIGTDRSTGDSLAPLVGYLLKGRLKRLHLYGTIDEPVHAKNLVQVLDTINSKYENPFILAIDACLGKEENIGNIYLQEGALQPGAALKKDLPPVGTMSIKANVNVGGFMPGMVLQHTRLSHVMKQADIIAKALAEVDKRMRRTRRKVQDKVFVRI